jgi:hypothetical protein
MRDEARRIIDAGTARGLALRMLGGLAVREYCRALPFCERDYSGIDLVGRRRDYGDIAALFRSMGYDENHNVRFATRGRQLQFYRECDHPDASLHYFIHPDDHVDVFLDTFRMDHDIPLADRLEIERYTLSATDVLLTKLQVTRLTEKDVRDTIVLLKDVPLGDDDEPGVINVAHIARLTADDWGLYHDVTRSLAAASTALTVYDTSDLDRETVAAAVEKLTAAVEEEPKSRRWQRRSRVGERKPWSNPVEEQEEEEDHGPPLRGYGAGPETPLE